jgi:hypothetical protein
VYTILQPLRRVNGHDFGAELDFDYTTVKFADGSIVPTIANFFVGTKEYDSE